MYYLIFYLKSISSPQHWNCHWNVLKFTNVIHFECSECSCFFLIPDTQDLPSGLMEALLGGPHSAETDVEIALQHALKAMIINAVKKVNAPLKQEVSQLKKSALDKNQLVTSWFPSCLIHLTPRDFICQCWSCCTVLSCQDCCWQRPSGFSLSQFSHSLPNRFMDWVLLLNTSMSMC